MVNKRMMKITALFTVQIFFLAQTFEISKPVFAESLGVQHTSSVQAVLGPNSTNLNTSLVCNGIEPKNGSTTVNVSTNIIFTFNDSILKGNSFGDITLKDSYGNSVEITTEINWDKVIISPVSPLKYNTTYTATMPKAAVGDWFMNSTDTQYNVNFTTKALEKIISFPDQGLESAVREALNKTTGSITESDMGTLKDLMAGVGDFEDSDVSYYDIKDLSGIEYAINLETLNLVKNVDLVDISPLKSLAKLRTLRIDGCKIRDITPLSGLTSLQSLNGFDNQITDITALSRLTKLKDIELGRNNISNALAVANLPNLTSLSLPVNNIGSIQSILPFLKGAPMLASLDLSLNRITDINGIEQLGELGQLDLGYNEIGDITPIKLLNKLWVLSLQHNKISNIGAISGLAMLKNLNLEENQITDISPLVALTNLDTLYLGNNNISSISPLSGLVKLHSLDLDHNKITDITILETLKKSGAFTAGVDPIALNIDNNILNLGSGTSSRRIVEYLSHYFSSNFIYYPQKSTTIIPVPDSINVPVTSEITVTFDEAIRYFETPGQKNL